MGEVLGIDAASWQVRLLPHPNRFTRSRALGFCGGHPVGMAETARAKSHACWWPDGTHTLEGAEAAALVSTCERAQLADGQDVLELGCGWGSLTLEMARRYPGSRITAVSNSSSQRDYILAEAGRRDLTNVRVITADMNTFMIAQRFDRVVEAVSIAVGDAARLGGWAGRCVGSIHALSI